MKILDDFKIKNKKITILSLKSDEYNNFIEKLPDDFLFSYITEEELKNQKAEFGETASDIYNQYIPDNPSLMSGEFGEIISYSLLEEIYERKGFVLNGLKKTLFKEAKNVASHGTDIVLFHQNSLTKPSKDDVLISAEIKTKATKNKESSIVKAVKDAEKDNLSRLSETLIWLKRAYKENKDTDGFNSIQRFADPVKSGKYEKHFKAIAIIDKDFKSYEKVPKKTSIKDDFEIILILIDNLKSSYQSVYANIYKSIENV